MTDFKLYGKCHGCKRERFFIRKAKVTLPNGLKATSHDLMCGSCIDKLNGITK